MDKKTNFKLLKTTIACACILSSLSGCVKTVDCDINGNHVHLYIDNNTKLSRYINSEKEYVGSLERTDSYQQMTDELEIIDENGLYIIEDNLEYLNTTIDRYNPKREAYVYDYIYGTYYGYGYGYNYSSGKYEYSYGLIQGYHWDYDWQEIGLDEYTNDKVRDITYQFRFYKINSDGSISEKLFNSLDEISSEYKYFTPKTLIQENKSNPYYLDKNKQKSLDN